MAPTVGSKADGKSPVRNRRPGGTIERSGLICRVKYTNKLPDIPFDPKSLKYPFSRNRFIKYKPTTLEKLCKVELHTDFDLGVNVDLIDPETYIRPPNVTLDKKDNELLQEDDKAKSDTRRSGIHNKQVTFFRASEYISQDFKQYGVSKEKTESKIGAGSKDRFKEEEIYKDREAQIKAIEKTFKDAQLPVVEHYSKKGVTAIETMPLLPDFEMWKHPCAQVIFDTDPAPKGIVRTNQHAIMSQAMIRGMVDEDNDQFVAYFLPTDDTVEKRDRDKKLGVNYDDEEVYDYRLTKEYNWNVKNKASKGYEENFFFCYRPNEGVFYNELETRVRLSKRVKGRDNQKTQHSNTILAVKHRKMDENEIQAQEMRKQALEHTVEDDGSDEEDDDSSDDSSAAGDKDSDDGEAKTEAEDGEVNRRGEEDAKSDSESGEDAPEEKTEVKKDSDSEEEDGDDKKQIFGADSDSDSSDKKSDSD